MLYLRSQNKFGAKRFTYATYRYRTWLMQPLIGAYYNEPMTEPEMLSSGIGIFISFKIDVEIRKIL